MSQVVQQFMGDVTTVAVLDVVQVQADVETGGPASPAPVTD